jgi:hypothetical protein
MPIANAQVNMTVTDPTGAVTTSTVTTDQNGAASMALAITMVGDYIVKADYAGDTTVFPIIEPATASVTITGTPAPIVSVLTMTPAATTGAVGTSVPIAIVLGP